MNDTQTSSATTAKPLVECQKLVKQYNEQGDTKLATQVLKGINLTIKAGEQVAILGQSGSGKSTLLHLLGMLDDPSEGKLFIDGVDVTELDETQRADFRNQHMGFIYQFHHLLMEFSAVENVAMPLLIAGVKPKEANKKAKELLQQVGLSHRLNHRPAQLSGGERQRVAIARALVNSPKLVMADEPTGNLDKQNAQAVFDLFRTLNQQHGTSLIVVTHDVELANQFQRVIRLDDGIVVE